MEEQAKKNKSKKVFIYLGVGLGIIALGAGTYWLIYGRQKAEKPKEPTDDLLKNLEKESDKPKVTYTPTAPKNTSAPPPKASTGFPLQKNGDKILIKQLQEALIKTYGKSVLPTYGADGDLGPETKKALISKGYSVPLDEASFKKIVGVADPVKPSTASETGITNEAAIKIASTIISRTKAKDVVGIVLELRKLKNIKDYTKVNEPFKAFTLDGKEQSLVDGMLSTFDEEPYKMTLKAEFFRIGLKFKDGTWSLSGLSCSPRLMTKNETTIRNMSGCSIVVPANTIIGTVSGTKGTDTVFTTLDGQVLCAPTKDVRLV